MLLDLLGQHTAILTATRHVAALAPTPGAISPGPAAPFQVTKVPARLVRTFAERGWLESVWVSVSFAVSAVVAGYVAVFRRLRRGAWNRGRRGRLVTLGAMVATLSLVVLSVAAGVNTHVGYVKSLGALKARLFGDELPNLQSTGPGIVAASKGKPSPVPGKTAEGGAQPEPKLPPPPAAGVAPLTRSQLVQLPLHASAYGLDNAPAYVYLPAGYAPTGHPWPVLFLIGGAPGSTDDWIHPGNANVVMDGLIKAHIIKPFVVVMPTTNPSFLVDDECLDSARGGPRIESYLVDIVLPAVQTQLNVDHDRHLHGIAGFSAGADCALNVGLRHLSLFSAIGTIEAQGRPGYKAENRMLNADPALVRANSPMDYIPTMAFDQSLVVYLNAAGKYDTPDNDKLQSELQGRGVYVYRHDETGFGHNWRDARVDLPWLLSFMSSAFDAPAPPAPAGTAAPVPLG